MITIKRCGTRSLCYLCSMCEAAQLFQWTRKLASHPHLPWRQPSHTRQTHAHSQPLFDIRTLRVYLYFTENNVSSMLHASVMNFLSHVIHIYRVTFIHIYARIYTQMHVYTYTNLKAAPLPPAPSEVQQLSRSEDQRSVALLRLLRTHLLLHGLSAKVPWLVGVLVDWLVGWLVG
jgi:hypothetical protein